MATLAGAEVVAVIPTYRPTGDLLALIDAVEPQVSAVLISDDGSPCTFDPLLREVAGKKHLSVIRHTVNAGIARGLNDGLRMAQSVGATWLLTIDQDSTISSKYVSAIVQAATHRMNERDRLGAIGAGTVEDRAGVMTYPLRENSHGPVTEELIQTGTLWSVSALIEIGGFDESLRIDAVDAAACLRLREHGYSIAIAPQLTIRHSIGSARTFAVLGRNIMITGHSPARRTSMLRNRFRLFPAEFRQSPRHAIRTIRRVMTNQALGLVLERERSAKARASLKALLPGAQKE